MIGIVGRTLGWTTLAVLLALYGIGGMFAPYVLLLLEALILLYVLVVRRGSGWTPDITGRGFLAAFALLTIAYAFAAEQPSDVLVVANFVWLLLYISTHALMRRMAGRTVAVGIARLALLGVTVTLAVAAYQGLVVGAVRARFFDTDPIRIANTAVILGFVSLLGLLTDSGRRRFLYLAGPVFAVGVAYLAGTRGAMMSAAVVAVVCVLYLVRRRGVALAVAAGLAVAIAAALVVAAQLHVHRIESLVRTFQELLTGQPISDGSAEIRVAMIRAAWQAFWHSPWFGYGWQRLLTATTPYLPPGQENLFHGQPHLHDDTANFAVAAGLLGLAAYAAILLSPLVAAIRSPRDRLYRARLFGIVVLVTAYAALGLDSLMFGFEVHTAMYCTLCAVLLGCVRDDAPSTRG